MDYARIKHVVSENLVLVVVAGGVALASAFAFAEKVDLFGLSAQHVTMYGSMPVTEQRMKPSAPSSSESSVSSKPDRAALRKAAKEKREKQRLERLKRRVKS